MITDKITIARAIKPAVPLAKIIYVKDDQIARVDPAPRAFIYSFEEVPICGLEELQSALVRAAAKGAIVVRARPRAAQGRRAIQDDPEKGPAGLEIVPRHWVAFDWDGLPLEPQSGPQPPELADDEAEFCNWSVPDPVLDPECGARAALRRLPPPFREVSCLWQVSASAGFKPGFRLRTWHLLDHPTTGKELKVWLQPVIKRGLVDPVTLVEAQPHFVAVTVVGGRDPCPCRYGIFRQARDLVSVPDLAAIARRQRERGRAARPAFRGAHAGSANNGIEECLNTIRAAQFRHSTYVQEAARAHAICNRSGLDWQRARRDLIAAYESSLSPEEARLRRRTSTEGVLDWLERRSST